MAEPTKLTVKTEKPSVPSVQTWHPFENLRREIDRLFDDFAAKILERMPSLHRRGGRFLGLDGQFSGFGHGISSR